MRKALLRLLLIIFVTACQSQTGNNANYNPGADTTATDAYSPASGQSVNYPTHFGFGKKASAKAINLWDSDIRPDGKGLPEGKGRIQTGMLVYKEKCSSCHGVKGEGGSSVRLVGIMGDTVKTKTIGNYWPYATTLFDYIRRAMPFNAPGSLHDDEVYDLTACLLYMNKIIDSTTILTKKNLPKLIMPAKALFVNDDRKGGPEIK